MTLTIDDLYSLEEYARKLADFRSRVKADFEGKLPVSVKILYTSP